MNVGDIRAAHATDADWRVAAAACLQALGLEGGAANLGFVYASDVFAPHFPDIAAFLRDNTGIEHWVGSVAWESALRVSNISTRRPCAC